MPPDRRQQKPRKRTFDGTLIQAAQKGSYVELEVFRPQQASPEYLDCKIVTVDKFFIEVNIEEVDIEEGKVWINKGYIVRCQIRGG